MTLGLRRLGALGALIALLCACVLLLPTVTRSEDDASISTGETSSSSGNADASPAADGADLTESGRARGPVADIPSAVRDLPDSIEVRFGDGRSELFLPVHKRSDGAFLRVGDMGRICGHGFVWDPDTYRGEDRSGHRECLLPPRLADLLDGEHVRAAPRARRLRRQSALPADLAAQRGDRSCLRGADGVECETGTALRRGTAPVARGHRLRSERADLRHLDPAASRRRLPPSLGSSRRARRRNPRTPPAAGTDSAELPRS